MHEPGTRRHPATVGAIALLAVLAVAEFIYGSRIVEAVVGTNNLSPGLVVGAVADATRPLLLAAALFSGPTLGRGYRTITAGTALIAAGAVVTAGLGIWAFGPIWQAIFDTLDPTATAVYRDAGLAASMISIGGWLLVARGITLGRAQAPTGTARLAIIAVTAAAVLANAAGLIPLFGTPPATDQAIWIATLTLAMLGIVATGAVAVLALGTAAPGPPLDWRWVVGAGFAIQHVAAAAMQWRFVADPYHLPGWVIWLRLLGTGGALLVVAGFAIAAAVRWPPAPSPTLRDLPAVD